MIRIAFIGAGLIGKERVSAVETLIREGRPLVPVALLDPLAPDAADIARRIGASVCRNLDELLGSRPDWVVVATPHDVAADVVPKLLATGVKVLVEKPLGRNLAEAERMAAAVSSPHRLWVGHNFRFFPGIAALLKDLREERFGQITSMSLLFGHGGGPKDVGSWKLDPNRAGGGVLIDPGIHLLDLINHVEGRLPGVVGGTSWSGFWKTGIEEDVRLLLRGQTVPVFDVTISIVHWRSTFRLEVLGLDGYGVVEGRGRSYGVQRYRYGPRWGWEKGGTQAASEIVVVESDCTQSFADELRTLLFDEANPWGARPCSLAETIENMRLLENCRTALSL